MVSHASVLQSKKNKERNLDFISQLYLNKTKEKKKEISYSFDITYNYHKIFL